ncbi:MAG TPA: hypothetical protein DCL21_03515 [Alphaproteobacteria bacterium]|nr:hypothetical protein [Alphaproteobacteria bacterium]
MLKKLLLVSLLIVQGCSVYLAADGKESPNIQTFHDGMTRFQVESVLGAPTSYKKLKEANSQAIYEFEIGNEPAPGRAALWLGIHLITFSASELILTPYELNKGETKRIKVNYNEDEVVTHLEL